ncbi:MAG: zinc ribbon domain-containing protein [Candidatus Jordarchaeales archaeon]
MSNGEKSFSGIHKGSIVFCAFLIISSLTMLSVSPNLIPYVSSHTYNPTIIGSFYLPNIPSDGFSLIYISPGEEAHQPLMLPSRLSCVFGVVASNQPVKFKIYGIHPVPVIEPGILPSWQDTLLDTEVSSTSFFTYPPANDYMVLLVWKNEGSQPALIMTQSSVTFLTFQSNPFIPLLYSLRFIGILILLFTIIGALFKPSPPETLEGAGDVFVEALRLTPKALFYIILPVGFLLSIQYIADRLSYILTQIQSLSFTPPAILSQVSLASTVASLLVTFLLLVMVAGIVIAFVHVIVEQGRPALLESIEIGFRRYLKLTATTIIVGLIVGVGLLLLIIPGIYFATVYALAPQAVIVENAGVRESLRRSKELTNGAKLKTFLLFLMFGIIYLIISQLINYILSTMIPIQLQLAGSLVFPFLSILLPYPPLDFSLVVFIFPAVFGACLVAGFLASIAVSLYLTGFTLWFYALGGGAPRKSVTQYEYKLKATECRACGRSIPEEANYCPYCGEKIK